MMKDPLNRSGGTAPCSTVLTPIPRLLTAGHWAFSLGASPVAVLTGKMAAEHGLNNSDGDR